MENKFSQLHVLFKELIQEAIGEVIENNNLMNHQIVEEKPKGMLDEVIDADEAAQLLHIAKQTLYTLTSKRKIPFYKQGKKILFKRSELEQWLTKGKHIDHRDILRDAKSYTANNPIKR